MIFTCTRIQGRLQDTIRIANYSSFLSKSNNTAYTPTYDYHPATKKYVDDSIAENNSGEDQLPYVIFMPGNNQYGIGMNKTIKSGETFDNMQNFLNKKYEDFYVIIRYNNFNLGYGGDFAAYRCYYTDRPSLYSEGEHSERFVTAGVLADNNFAQNSEMSHVDEFVSLKVTINYTVSEGNIALTSISIGYIRQDAWLAKNNTSSYTPTSDYHPATKKYVDDSISSIQIDKYTYLVDSNISLSSSYKGYTSDLSSSICDALTNIINDAYTKSKKKIRLIMLINNSPVTFESGIYYTTESNKTNYINILNKPTNMSYNAMAHYGHPTGTNTSSDYFTLLYNLTLVIGFDISWNENNVATVSNAKIRVPHSGQSIMSVPYINANYLSKTNTTAYTPTADYHPATKKYVDDSVSGCDTVIYGYQPTQLTSYERFESEILEQLQTQIDEKISNGKQLYELSILVESSGRFALFKPYMITSTYVTYKGTYLGYGGGYYAMDIEIKINKTNNKLESYYTKLGYVYYAYADKDNFKSVSKKYVDDSIASAITTVLEGEY